MRSTERTAMAASARGDVSVSMVGGGARIPFVARHNTLSYAAAGAVAAAYGGDDTFVPKYIGFIYGGDSSPTELADLSDRDMRWDDVKSEMKRIGGNILVCRFISPPELSTNQPDPGSAEEDPKEYSDNAVTFRSCTRSGAAGTYAFDTSEESGFAGEFGDGMYLYHAVLLGDGPCQSCQEEKEYRILARVSLEKGGRFRKKPEDYELALDWKVSFF